MASFANGYSSRRLDNTISILIDDLIRKETGHSINTYINCNTIQYAGKDRKRYIAKDLKIPLLKEKFNGILDAIKIIRVKQLQSFI